MDIFSFKKLPLCRGLYKMSIYYTILIHIKQGCGLMKGSLFLQGLYKIIFMTDMCSKFASNWTFIYLFKHFRVHQQNSNQNALFYVSDRQLQFKFI